MIRAGFETTEPFTLPGTVVVEGAEETVGGGWVIEVHCPEGARPAILEHVHVTWSETFEILEAVSYTHLRAHETNDLISYSVLCL